MTTTTTNADSDEKPLCYSESRKLKSFLCRPFHKCLLPEFHEGSHTCDCGITWRWRDYERKENQE